MDVDIEVQVEEAGADPERLDELTMLLQRRLGELDGAQTTRQDGPAPPPGARGDALSLGALLVSIVDSAALAAVVRQVVGWLGGGTPQTRKVRLQLGDDVLELEGASGEEQTQLVSAFLARHQAT